MIFFNFLERILKKERFETQGEARVVECREGKGQERVSLRRSERTTSEGNYKTAEMETSNDAVFSNLSVLIRSLQPARAARPRLMRPVAWLNKERWALHFVMVKRCGLNTDGFGKPNN